MSTDIEKEGIQLLLTVIVGQPACCGVRQRNFDSILKILDMNNYNNHKEIN
jgi:hypothetical protein